MSVHMELKQKNEMINAREPKSKHFVAQYKFKWFQKQCFYSLVVVDFDELDYSIWNII